jgi:hypothetical protein
MLVVPAALAQPPDENKIASQNVARATVERAVKAHGGDIKVGRSRLINLKLRAKVMLPPDAEAPFALEITAQLPDKYRSVVTTNYQGVPITRTVIINGDQGWATVNDQGKELTAKEIKEAKEQMYAETVARLITLRESDYQLKAMDDVMMDKRSVQVVNVVSKGHREVNLFFDKQTGLLVKMEHVVHDHEAKESSQEVVFSGHRDTNGPKHWGKAVVFNNHNRIFEAELAEVRFPEKLDDRLFQKPAQVKPEKDKTDKDKKATTEKK